MGSFLWNTYTVKIYSQWKLSVTYPQCEYISHMESLSYMWQSDNVRTFFPWEAFCDRNYTVGAHFSMGSFLWNTYMYICTQKRRIIIPIWGCLWHTYTVGTYSHRNLLFHTSLPGHPPTVFFDIPTLYGHIPLEGWQCRDIFP